MARKLDSELCATLSDFVHWADNLQIAAVVFDNAVNHRQPKTCAFPGVFGCEKRFQYLIHLVGWDTATFICYREHNAIFVLDTVLHNTSLGCTELPGIHVDVTHLINYVLYVDCVDLYIGYL